MNDGQVLDALIKLSKYVQRHESLSPIRLSEDSKLLLIKGDCCDELCAYLKSQGKKLLDDYYQKHRDDAIKVLKRLQNLKRVPTTKEEITESLGIKNDRTHVCYIMERLREEGVIAISVSTDYDKKIKFLI